MSFDKSTRNLLAKTVAACHDLLAADISDQLQSRYGLYPDGSTLDVARTEAARRAAAELGALWEHYASSEPGEQRKRDKAQARLKAAYPRLVREIGFTLLNRLAALRLCEERGLLVECVRKGMESDGFRLYDRLAGGALGNRYETYRAFTESLFDELALDLGVLFDRRTPHSHVFPSEAALVGVLAELNKSELAALEIWQQDETIGWIYQYYNDPAERKKMRDESQAPRNSRELAVRNQFFTPRYVVEFLTDNTLGRTWYEMRQGETRLIDECRYLVRRKHPVFLRTGGQPPEPYDPVRDGFSDPDLPGEMWVRPNPEIDDTGGIFYYALTVGGYDYARERLGRECGELANERLKKFHETGKWEGGFEELRCCLFFEQRRYHHFGRGPEGDERETIEALYQAICERWDWEVEFITFREKKDPRDLKILDPACGSGHFLLYAFDLLLAIYEEAWGDPDLPPCEATHTYLAQDYADLDDLRRAAPGLILSHNLHGIEIDPRAAQIAALALWLRSQRAYQELKLRPAERPRIEKSNIVVAEPMPGDLTLREEFLQTIRQPFIRYLVQTVFEKMELAGEAGSLLKIDEEIREPIRQAKQQWLKKSKAEQLTLWPEKSRPKAEQLALFDISGISDETFWDRAEEMALEALHEYAKLAQNGNRVRRRLFVQDAEEGFGFIHLIQMFYDIVLMNPPFGTSTSNSDDYFQGYMTYTDNIAAPFAERYLQKSIFLGMVVDRSLLIRKTHEGFRNLFVGDPKSHLMGFANFGWGTLDAYVEVSAILGNSRSVRSSFLLKEIEIFQPEKVAWIPNYSFSMLPNRVISGDIPDFVLNAFGNIPKLGETSAAARVGHQWKSDRFLRLWWEVKNGGSYVYNGAPYSSYQFITRNRMTKYPNDLEVVSDETTFLRNERFHYKSGVCYGKRGVFLDAHPLPEGQTFTVEGLACFPNSTENRLTLLAFLNSTPVQVLLSYYSGQHKHVGYVNKLPFRPSWRLSLSLLAILTDVLQRKRNLLQMDESSPLFTSLPLSHSLKEGHSSFVSMIRNLDIDLDKVDIAVADEVASWFYFPPTWQEIPEVKKFLSQRPTSNATSIFDEDGMGTITSYSSFIINQALGFVYGNWDIRFTIDNTLIPALPEDLFVALPKYPPGMLIGPEGMPGHQGRIVSEAWLRARPDAITLPTMDELGSVIGKDGKLYPATIPDEKYPIQIQWDGILVDDPGLDEKSLHPADIVRRVREVLAVLWANNHDAIEAEACEILSVSELREYFRKPSGFFADHLKRYSKSRRQAPIYWPLSTESGRYTLWVYYHRLSDDILYTAVNRYLEPKIGQVERRMADLQASLSAPLSESGGGRSSTALRDELDDLRDFLAELRAFRDELLRIAALPFKPDLNDGVILNAAPFHKLFRLSKWAKATDDAWKKLEAGKYDWAHIAYNIWPERVREACKQDKSIAIAHGLEELYVEKPGKKSKKKSTREDEDFEQDEMELTE